jgi:flagellar biosynthesis/type III secretory pathway protein FliH
MMSFKNWTPPNFAAGAPSAGPPSAPRVHVDVEQAAYARGFADGQKDGAVAAEKRLLSVRRALEGTAKSINDARAGLTAEIEETVTVVALAIAQRLVARELRADPAAIADLVRRTIATLPPSAPPSVRIHPEDLAALDNAEPLAVDSSRSVDVEWIPDASVERGGYVVETPQRVLEARLTSVFQDFYERLRDA